MANPQATAPQDTTADVGREPITAQIEPRIDEFFALQTLPFGLPRAQHETDHLGMSYVRPCYPDYYGHIMGAFGGGVGAVTVAASQGVGSSAFLAYFLHRYQLQHPNCTFVYASYDLQSKFNQAFLWLNGDIERELTRDELLRAGKDDPDAIFLLDGAPNRLPWSTAHRFVVCTSPNAVWDKKTGSYSGHMQLFVPLWELDELTAAVDALDLQIKPMSSIEDFPRQDGEAEMEYRLRVFGGIACPCLGTNLRAVNRLANQRKTEVQTLLEVGVVHAMLIGDPCKDVSTWLYLCSPSSSLHEPMYELSPYACHLLVRRLDELDNRSRKRARSICDGIPAAGSLHGHFVESDVHGILKRGIEIVAYSVDEATKGTEFRLQILPTAEVIPFESTFTLKTIGPGPYYKPASKRFESVDAFYMVTDELAESQRWADVKVVLFQFTTAANHPVKARGLRAVLNKLAITEYSSVVLVFAIVEGRAELFKKQRILAVSSLVDGSPLKQVGKITRKVRGELKTIGITTVGELRSPPSELKSTGVVINARQSLIEYEECEVFEDSADHHALQSILQFKWTVPSAYAELVSRCKIRVGLASSREIEA